MANNGLRRIAADLALPGVIPESNLAACNVILDRIEYVASQKNIDALARLTQELPSLFTDPVTSDEIAMAERVQDQWGIISTQFPPLRPCGWSVQILNTSMEYLLGSYEKFLAYWLGARTRVTGMPSGGIANYELPDPLELLMHASLDGIRPGGELERSYSQFVDLVSGWLQVGSLNDSRTTVAELDRLVFTFLRQQWYLTTDLRGSEHGIDPEHLALALLGLLPTLGPDSAATIAEALSLLNEVVLSGQTMVVERGNRQLEFTVPTLDILMRGLAAEIEVLTLLSGQGPLAERGRTELRAIAAKSAATWVRWPYSNYDPGSELRALAGPVLTTSLAVEVIRMGSIECPIAGIIALDAIFRAEFDRARPTPQPLRRRLWQGLSRRLGRRGDAGDDPSPSGIWDASNADPVNDYGAISKQLLHVNGNPSRLPLRVRYRTVVRTELVARPPIDRYIWRLAFQGDIDQGFAQCVEWWGALTPQIALTVTTQEEMAAMREWRRQVAEAISQAVSQRQERGLPVERPIEEALEIALNAEIGSTNAFDFVPSDLALSFQKGNQYKFLGYFNRAPGRLAESIQTGLARLYGNADELQIDIVALIVGEDAIRFLHRQPGGHWTAKQLKLLPRTFLVSLGAYIGRRPFGAADSLHDMWGDLTRDIGGDPADLPYGVAQRLGAVASGLEVGDKVAVVVAPELTPFPVTAAFASSLSQRNPDVAVGELDVAGLWENEASQGPAALTLNRFEGFVLPGMKDSEVGWGRLGLPGSVRRSFTGDDIVASLEDGTSIVHLVSHGLLDAGDPLFSLLVTGGDQHLMQTDLIGHELHAQLVMLNTCSSAAAGAFGGGMGSSFARVLLAGGVKAMLGNVLPVETDVALQFAEEFQAQMSRSDCSPALAFARSSAVARQDNYAAPLTLLARSLPAMFGTPNIDR
jgi:hypothetical protein